MHCRNCMVILVVGMIIDYVFMKFKHCDQTTPWQGVYFFTNTVKVGAE